MKDCIFCRIRDKIIKIDIVFESRQVLVFADIDPVADTHLLIVPKKHISSVLSLNSTHERILREMINIAKRIIKDENLEKEGYRLVFNGGAFQHISHLHWHLLGGNLKKMV